MNHIKLFEEYSINELTEGPERSNLKRDILICDDCGFTGPENKFKGIFRKKLRYLAKTKYDSVFNVKKAIKELELITGNGT